MRSRNHLVLLVVIEICYQYPKSHTNRARISLEKVLLYDIVYNRMINNFFLNANRRKKHVKYIYGEVLRRQILSNLSTVESGLLFVEKQRTNYL